MPPLQTVGTGVMMSVDPDEDTKEKVRDLLGDRAADLIDEDDE